MDSSQKKQLKNNYKSKPAVGAVYGILCSGSGRCLLKSTTDIAGIQNRFRFSRSIDGPPDPALRREWEQFGSSSFSLHVFEELKQKENQTAREFADDIAVLLELWQEKDIAAIAADAKEEEEK